MPRSPIISRPYSNPFTSDHDRHSGAARYALVQKAFDLFHHTRPAILALDVRKPLSPELARHVWVIEQIRQAGVELVGMPIIEAAVRAKHLPRQHAAMA